MMEGNVLFVITHPTGNATHNYRINSFLKILNTNGYSGKVTNIVYPFRSSYQGISQELSIISSNLLIDIIPKINNIQKLVRFSQKIGFPYILTKIFYAFHILIYKIDLWYINLHKQKRILEKELRSNTIIVGSGGPGSVLKMAYLLAEQKHLELIIDYRDPWNFGYNLLGTGSIINFFKRKLMIQTERRILAKAKFIITVSESIKNFLPLEHHHKTLVIENGSNFEQNEIIDKINAYPVNFNLVYVGTIYNDQLVDQNFFKAFSIFCKSVNYKNVALKFIGSDKNIKLRKLINKYKLEDITEVTTRLDTSKLLPYLLNASMFLHLKFNERSNIITSKQADYLMFRKPIMLPSSDNGDLEESINKFKAGYICNGVEDIVDKLSQAYLKYLNKESITLYQKDISFISRSNLAERFLKVIDQVSLTPPNSS